MRDTTTNSQSNKLWVILMTGQTFKMCLSAKNETRTRRKRAFNKMRHQSRHFKGKSIQYDMWNSCIICPSSLLFYTSRCRKDLCLSCRSSRRPPHFSRCILGIEISFKMARWDWFSGDRWDERGDNKEEESSKLNMHSANQHCTCDSLSNVTPKTPK